jgi:RNA polymerase subunit RPABC4/transcription elongation factor Spt4
MIVRDTRPIKTEIMVIPEWAYVVALIVFVVFPICFFFLSSVWSPGSDVPLPFRILLTFFPGTVLAFLALMVGYVNKDAGLRGMNRKLWTLLVIFIPNAIGFILYFLLRSPLQIECPKCGTVVDSRVNFCPACRYSFHQTCPHCRAMVRPGDTFCANCGDTIPQP